MNINNTTTSATEFKLLLNYRERVRPLQLRLLHTRLQYELQKQNHPMIRAYNELNIDGCPLEVVNSEDLAIRDIREFLKHNIDYSIAIHGLKIATDLDQAKALAECHYDTDAKLIYNLWTKVCNDIHELMRPFVNDSYDTAITAIEDRWDDIPIMAVVVA